MVELSGLRRDFDNFNLNEKEMFKNPVRQLQAWLNEADKKGLQDYNAMVLSTVEKRNGRPSSRVVLLKDVTEKGDLVFFTNYDSQKGKEIEENPFVALNFFWKELERQIRIEGKISKTNRNTSEKYFNSRPVESQISAIVSPQSEEIKNLDRLLRDSAKLLAENTIKIPDNWGGYLVTPDYYEFWQGGKNRLHHRISYGKKNKSWIKARLAP